MCAWTVLEIKTIDETCHNIILFARILNDINLTNNIMIVHHLIICTALHQKPFEISVRRCQCCHQIQAIVKQSVSRGE